MESNRGPVVGVLPLPRQAVVGVVVSDTALRTVLTDILTDEGYAVQVFATAGALLEERAAGTRPAVLLVEPWGMLQTDAQALRHWLGEHRPIVALRSGLRATSVEAILCPVSTLPMPFALDDLLALLGTVSPT